MRCAHAVLMVVGAALPWHLPLLHWRGSALDPGLGVILGAAVLIAAAALLRRTWAHVATIGWSSAALFFMLLSYANAPLNPGPGKALSLAGAIAGLGGGVLGWHDVWAAGSSRAERPPGRQTGARH